MSDSLCLDCRKPKAEFTCGVCEEPICKNCLEYLEPGSFSFLAQIPADLGHLRYCRFCFDGKVVPAREEYAATMDEAKQVFIFFTTQKSMPVHKRGKTRVEVKDCPDRDETILRLAFRAVEQGFNAVIDTEVKADKVRNEGWQKMKWRGVGLPAKVDADKLNREDREDYDGWE